MATVLKRGSKGAAVREIQELLNAAGATPQLDVDGNFGGGTENAVRAFQRSFGLVGDGRVGPQTRTALKQATTPTKPGKPEPDKSAMNQAASSAAVVGTRGSPPPNVASLKLLDTARPITEIIWHCTATPEGKDYTVDDIRAWHKQRGWSDIGYHYVVYRDGRIMVGRPVGQVGAHTEGHNSGTVGPSYVGGVSAVGKTAKDTRTAAQRASMMWLTEQLAAKHRGVRKVRGHHDQPDREEAALGLSSLAADLPAAVSRRCR